MFGDNVGGRVCAGIMGGLQKTWRDIGCVITIPHSSCPGGWGAIVNLYPHTDYDDVDRDHYLDHYDEDDDGVGEAQV